MAELNIFLTKIETNSGMSLVLLDNKYMQAHKLSVPHKHLERDSAEKEMSKGKVRILQGQSLHRPRYSV
jgi:hypothetical protein